MSNRSHLQQTTRYQQIVKQHYIIRRWTAILCLVVQLSSCNAFSMATTRCQTLKDISNGTRRRQSTTALQVIAFDNSMHTTLSNLLPPTTSTAASGIDSFAEYVPTSPNSDIIANWLRNTATVDIFEMSHMDDIDVLLELSNAEDIDVAAADKVGQTIVAPSSNDISASNIQSTSNTISSNDNNNNYRQLTNEEVLTLQNAFGSFYGGQGIQKDLPQAYELFTKCIKIWKETQQSGDEIAGLYRVRGDLNMVSDDDVGSILNTLSQILHVARVILCVLALKHSFN